MKIGKATVAQTAICDAAAGQDAERAALEAAARAAVVELKSQRQPIPGYGRCWTSPRWAWRR